MSKVHYKGISGEFDFDSEMFETDEEGYLHLRPGYRGYIDLPRGCTSCRAMFKDSNLHGCYFRVFYTYDVTDMDSMFYGCEFPHHYFSLGECFNTSKVETMSNMFKECKLPKDFTLGGEFDTSNVMSMAGMFEKCTIQECPTPDDKFDDIPDTEPRPVLPKQFALGDKFDTSSVKDMGRMFYDCSLPTGFTFGAKFDTAQVTNMAYMFYSSRLPEGFTLGAKFDISGVTDMKSMFVSATLPSCCKGLSEVPDIVEALKGGAVTFDCVEYLKDLFCERYVDLPQASIANCETKEDCDELGRRYL